MRPKKHETTGSGDLFRARLDQIINMRLDKGYRGHDAPNPRRVFISGQKRGVFGRIKRELRRRSAIEAVIGHAPAMPPTSSSAPSVTTFASFSHG